MPWGLPAIAKMDLRTFLFLTGSYSRAKKAHWGTRNCVIVALVFWHLCAAVYRQWVHLSSSTIVRKNTTLACCTGLHTCNALWMFCIDKQSWFYIYLSISQVAPNMPRGNKRLQRSRGGAAVVDLLRVSKTSLALLPEHVTRLHACHSTATNLHKFAKLACLLATAAGSCRSYMVVLCDHA